MRVVVGKQPPSLNEDGGITRKAEVSAWVKDTAPRTRRVE
jgi:hypothetical protein